MVHRCSTRKAVVLNYREPTNIWKVTSRLLSSENYLWNSHYRFPDGGDILITAGQPSDSLYFLLHLCLRRKLPSLVKGYSAPKPWSLRNSVRMGLFCFCFELTLQPDWIQILLLILFLLAVMWSFEVGQFVSRSAPLCSYISCCWLRWDCIPFELKTDSCEWVYSDSKPRLQPAQLYLSFQLQHSIRSTLKQTNKQTQKQLVFFIWFG